MSKTRGTDGLIAVTNKEGKKAEKEGNNRASILP